MNIVVAVPRSHSWVSLREILPALEAAWTSLGGRHRSTSGRPGRGPVRAYRGRGDRRRTVSVLRLGRRRTVPQLGALMRADLIVLTDAFSAIDLLEVLRSRLGISTPCVVHTHGECTSGARPLVAKMGRVLRRSDLLLCACEAEAAATRACFPAASVGVFAFPVLAVHRGLPRARPRRAGGKALFAYAGRISEQKNLHQLLFALWLLRRRRPRRRWSLDVFGKPDRHGSVHMGYRFRGYGAYLRRLALRLGLGSAVHWRGFLPAARLHRELAARPRIFVSPSLHSDEDFGVAALKSLAMGHSAVLSDWGGHRDLARRFRGKVRTVPVWEGSFGPFLRAEDLALALEAAAGGGAGRGAGTARGAYGLGEARRSLARWLRRLGGLPGGRLRFSRASRLIDARRPELRRLRARAGYLPTRGPRLWLGYRDPLARPFRRAYGALPALPATPRGLEAVIAAPWVHARSGSLEVAEPHRGRARLRWGGREDAGVVLKEAQGRAAMVPARVARWLLDNGLAARLSVRST